MFILIFLTALNSFAQDSGDFDIEEEQESEDKKKKEVEAKISLWNLKAYGALVDTTILDTLHDYNHIFHPVFKKALTASYIGNYGSPALDNNFFNRKFETNYFFAEGRDAYILSPSELDYYNTRTPYTRLDYTQSENRSKNNETRFNVIHSQNITPWWNFTFRIDLAKSEGQYVAQDAKNNTVALYTSYNKDQFNIYGGFISNSLRNFENGGITADSLLELEQDAEYWNVNLNSSESRFSSSYFFANGEYRFGKFINVGAEEDGEEEFRPLMGFLYSFEYNSNKQEFTDEEDLDNEFFENTYYPDSYIKDSIRFNRVSNVIQIKQYENADKRYSFGKRAFLGLEFDRGSMPNIVVENPNQKDYPTWMFGPRPDDWESDSIVLRTDISYSNLYIGGGIFRETGKFWKWDFSGKVYLRGRNTGQTELTGLIYKPIDFLGDSTASISFNGEITNKVANYFQDKFYSNHYSWYQNLDEEQRLTLGGEFKMPARKFKVGAKYSIINNYIYNDETGTPNQTGDEILVMSAYLDKDFNYRRLHFRTRLLWQKVSEEKYIHLPEWSTFISTYYQFTISKVLFTQIGADMRYNTKYYADAYAPSTGLFFLQNEKEYGDYPYIDIYANLRLKRTRVFFKWMNIGTNFLDGEYMTVPHYPMNRATFRLGVSWAFYD